MAKNESTGFSFSDVEVAVLKNFAAVNPSMVISPTGLSVINTAKSVVGFYDFNKPYSFEEFGVYEVPEFLSVLGALDNPVVEVNEKYLIVKSGDQKTRYFTTAKDLLPKVPSVAAKFDKVECELDFTLTADKLAALFKMAPIIKADWLFLESDGKKIRLTVGKELNTSSNTFDVTITSDIKANDLKSPIKVPLSDLKVLPGGYDVKISSAGISRWSSDVGPVYYIGVKAN